MTIERFNERYCVRCGSQGCFGAESEYAEGCKIYREIILGENMKELKEEDIIYVKNNNDKDDRSVTVFQYIDMLHKKIEKLKKEYDELSEKYHKGSIRYVETINQIVELNKKLENSN